MNAISWGRALPPRNVSVAEDTTLNLGFLLERYKMLSKSLDLSKTF